MYYYLLKALPILSFFHQQGFYVQKYFSLLFHLMDSKNQQIRIPLFPFTDKKSRGCFSICCNIIPLPRLHIITRSTFMLHANYTIILFYLYSIIIVLDDIFDTFNIPIIRYCPNPLNPAFFHLLCHYTPSLSCKDAIFSERDFSSSINCASRSSAFSGSLYS